MRIGLLGCAGLGKGTVARIVSRKLKIGLVESKDITRPVLDRLGYRHSDKCFVERLLARRDHEFEILYSRLQAEEEIKDFVADRTALECFVYAHLRIDTYSEDEFRLLEECCLENVRKYDRLYYIPFSHGWQERNGVRTINREFQWMVDALVRAVVEKWGLSPEIPPEGTAAETADWIVKKIKDSKES
ncbi:MAG: AAA family ATPase [Clostridia bacterium]|nr:AAA family ATPase [Clostridia bacterium]